MYFMIDNYDSFVYNLAAYMKENGQEIVVRRADMVTMEEIRALKPDGIIISPGPKRPVDAHVSREVLLQFQGKIPILGVCLGHQIIGHMYGAAVEHGKVPMHGKTTEITHDGRHLFSGLPQGYVVTRYHSLVVSEETLPSALRITAKSEDGVIMGLEHITFPVYGVQFHPEAVLTEYGHELLENFHQICQKWKVQQKGSSGNA